MQRINDRTVELTPIERHAHDHFDGLLDRGFGIIDAVDQTRAAYPLLLNQEFWAWLRGPVQCAARNPRAGGRCQRSTDRIDGLCPMHAGWKP